MQPGHSRWPPHSVPAQMASSAALMPPPLADCVFHCSTFSCFDLRKNIKLLGLGNIRSPAIFYHSALLLMGNVQTPKIPYSALAPVQPKIFTVSTPVILMSKPLTRASI